MKVFNPPLLTMLNLIKVAECCICHAETQLRFALYGFGNWVKVDNDWYCGKCAERCGMKKVANG